MLPFKTKTLTLIAQLTATPNKDQHVLKSAFTLVVKSGPNREVLRRYKPTYVKVEPAVGEDSSCLLTATFKTDFLKLYKEDMLGSDTILTAEIKPEIIKTK